MRNEGMRQEDQPYEKFLALGAESLTETELLAIILRTGTKDLSAVQLAGNVLSLARGPKEGLLGLYDLTLEELMQVRGIGIVKAVKLKCLTELSMRMSRARARESLSFHDPGSIAEYYMERLRHRDTECVVLLCLNSKGVLLREKEISHGSVRSSPVSPREIFLEALSARAVNIILLHNHPSGDPTPSRLDIEVTKKLAHIGAMLDIPLLDHIIIGDRSYVSLQEQKKMS